MPTAYDGAIESSTDAPPARWRLALLAFAALIVGGAALVAALALGVGDPPCMRVAAARIDGAGWQAGVREDDNTYYTSDDALLPPPFTIAVSGRSSDGAAWGIWIGAEDERFAALITRDGYLSTDNGATWREFRHIQRDDNTLCLHVAEGQMTLFVNNEVAWGGTIRLGSGEWGYVEME